MSEDFRYALSTAGPVRRLLDEEPATAIRVLTDPRGRVQPRLVEACTELLQRDVDEHGLVPQIPVPLGESFLYSEVLAARAPDLEAATTVIDALITSVLANDGS